MLNFASGEIDYLTEISIPYAELAKETMMGTSLRVTSELLGLSLDLPYPFRKTVEQIRQMVLRLDFLRIQNGSQYVLISVGASLLVGNAEFQEEMSYSDLMLVSCNLVRALLSDLDSA